MARILTATQQLLQNFTDSICLSADGGAVLGLLVGLSWLICCAVGCFCGGVLFSGVALREDVQQMFACGA